MSKLEQLPLFPLGIVLYPRERMPLHIFEPRYKEMTERCLAAGSPFGIVLFDEGKIAEIGCTARIANVLERYEDGRMDLLIGVEERFHVLDIYNDETYLTADVEVIEEPDEPLKRELKERMITQHMRLLELAGRTIRPNLYENQDNLSYIIAPNAGLTPQQKQEVLELLTENQRIDYLVGHLESLIPKVEKMENLRHQVQSNGHFKDFPPEDL
jgi:ATP-dependent Lon protease